MIETQRLIIKPLSYNELKKYVLSPDELAEELGLRPSQSLMDKETRDAILNDLLPFMGDPLKKPLFYTLWIMIEKSDKSVIGALCFHGEPDLNGEVEIGYGTDDGYRNKGYMTEAIAGLVEWIKTQKEVRRVKAETEPDNLSSVKVLENNGFELLQNSGNLVFKLNL